MQLRINPNLDLPEIARTYAEHGIVQVASLFDHETADHIEAALASLPWRLVCQNDDKRTVLLTREQLRAMSAEGKRLRPAFAGELRRISATLTSRTP